MWPFKKKHAPELSCVAKTIIEDLTRLKVEDWETVWDKFGCIYKHPQLMYALRANERIDSEGDEWITVNIIGLSNTALSDFDQFEIFNKLGILRKRIEQAQKDKQKKREEEILKLLFPKCFEKKA